MGGAKVNAKDSKYETGVSFARSRIITRYSWGGAGRQAGGRKGALSGLGSYQTSNCRPLLSPPLLRRWLTPLHRACCSCSEDVVDVLLHHQVRWFIFPFPLIQPHFPSVFFIIPEFHLFLCHLLFLTSPTPISSSSSSSSGGSERARQELADASSRGRSQRRREVLGATRPHFKQRQRDGPCRTDGSAPCRL